MEQKAVLQVSGIRTLLFEVKEYALRNKTLLNGPAKENRTEEDQNNEDNYASGQRVTMLKNSQAEHKEQTPQEKWATLPFGITIPLLRLRTYLLISQEI